MRIPAIHIDKLGLLHTAPAVATQTESGCCSPPDQGRGLQAGLQLALVHMKRAERVAMHKRQVFTQLETARCSLSWKLPATARNTRRGGSVVFRPRNYTSGDAVPTADLHAD